MTMNTYEKMEKFNPCKEQRFSDLLIMHKKLYPDFPMSTIFYAYKYAVIDKNVFKHAFVQYYDFEKRFYENRDDCRKKGFHIDEQASLKAYYEARRYAAYGILYSMERM